MLRRVLSMIVLCSIPLWMAMPCVAQDQAKGDKDKAAAKADQDKADKDKADKEKADKPKAEEIFTEGEIFRFISMEERDKMFQPGPDGWALDHNYKIIVQAPNEAKPRTAVLVEPRGGAHRQMLSDFKPGDLLTMDVDKKNRVHTLGPYTLHVGEDKPNVYVFIESTTEKDSKDVDITLVKLYKLGKFLTVQAPKIPGKSLPDPFVIDTIEKLKKGDTVEVLTRPGGTPLTILTFAPYIEPKSAVVAALAEADVAGGKTPLIQVTIDGNPISILIPGRKDEKGNWIPDAILSTAIKRYKNGDRVVVRFISAYDKNWLKEIARDLKPKARTQPAK
jgi:hypothetical protein